LKRRKSTKVALVANSTWNIYNFRLNLIKRLEKEHAEVIVIAPVDEYIHYLNKASNIRHIPVKNLSRKSTNPFKDLFLFIELFKIYKRERPDLIIHYTIKPNIFGNLAAALSKILSICVVTGLGYTFLNGGLARKISTFLYRISLKFSQKVLFENEDDRALFVKEKIVSQQNSISLNGCGVNTKHFRPAPRNRRDDKLVFLFIGRLLYDKGIVEFVEAAKRMKSQFNDVEFWVLGELDYGNPSAISKNQLLSWVDQKYIIYHGTTSDIKSFIKKSDVIVLPSYREGLPKVILEGMSMGKPIITTDTAGCKQTVDPGKNGLLVPVKNVSELVDAMAYMNKLEDIDLEVMGKLSRKKAVREFDDKIITTAFIDIINDILPKSKTLKRTTKRSKKKVR